MSFSLCDFSLAQNKTKQDPANPEMANDKLLVNDMYPELCRYGLKNKAHMQTQI
jgi:hypothetical protein